MVEMSIADRTVAILSPASEQGMRQGREILDCSKIPTGSQSFAQENWLDWMQWVRQQSRDFEAPSAALARGKKTREPRRGRKDKDYKLRDEEEDSFLPERCQDNARGR